MIRIFCFIILLFATTAFAASNDIQLYQNNKLIGTMTKEQFVNLNLAAEDYVLLLNAEKKGNLKLTILASDYDEDSSLYAYTFQMDWVDEATGTVIHTVTVSNKTKIPKDGVMYSSFRVFYRDTCEYAVPVLVGVIILLIAL